MENKRGGQRLGSGRKPLGLKKESMTLYVEKNYIIKYGSRDKARDRVYELIKADSESIYDGKENKSAAEIDEVGQFQESKLNYFDQPQEVKKRILVRNFEQYVVLKRDCSTPEEWAEIADEIRNSNLYEKQKALLLKPF